MQPKDSKKAGKKPVIVRAVQENRREESSDRRVGINDRRCGLDRRVRSKFVLFDRRKGTGRRLLARGRRYVPDRRNALRKSI